MLLKFDLSQYPNRCKKAKIYCIVSQQKNIYRHYYSMLLCYCVFSNTVGLKEKKEIFKTLYWNCAGTIDIFERNQFPLSLVRHGEKIKDLFKRIIKYYT